MQVDGVNAVSVSSGSGRLAPASSDNVAAAINVGDSNNSNNNLIDTNVNSDGQDIALPGDAPKPLKSMSTSDFLQLHNNAVDSTDNVMNKMMKILEAVLALKLLDETLEAAQDGQKGNKFEEIA